MEIFGDISNYKFCICSEYYPKKNRKKSSKEIPILESFFKAIKKRFKNSYQFQNNIRFFLEFVLENFRKNLGNFSKKKMSQRFRGQMSSLATLCMRLFEAQQNFKLLTPKNMSRKKSMKSKLRAHGERLFTSILDEGHRHFRLL